MMSNIISHVLCFTIDIDPTLIFQAFFGGGGSPFMFQQGGGGQRSSRQSGGGGGGFNFNFG